MPSANLTFLKAFLKSPMIVASAIPSSRHVERRVVRSAAVDNASLVVELGAGTGGTTRALLEAMPSTGKLLAIERTGSFLETLRDIGDSRLEVINDCASTLQDVVASRDLGQVDAIVSGIPFVTLPQDIARTVVRQIAAVLKPGGRFVAYQFATSVDEYTRPVLGTPKLEHEILNVPPLRVYTWRKSATDESMTASAGRGQNAQNM